MLTTIMIALSLLIISEANRYLLQGGTEGAVAGDGEGDSVGGGTPTGSSSSASSDTDYAYTIDIWIDYNWNIHETNQTYTITYQSVWESIKTMITLYCVSNNFGHMSFFWFRFALPAGTRYVPRKI